MRSRWAEFNKNRWLIRFYPGIDNLAALDSRGLLPVLPGGRNDNDAVLARHQILDVDIAKLVGLNSAVAQGIHNRITVAIQAAIICQRIGVGLAAGIVLRVSRASKAN